MQAPQAKHKTSLLRTTGLKTSCLGIVYPSAESPLSFIPAAAYFHFGSSDGLVQQIQQHFPLLGHQTGQKGPCCVPAEPEGFAIQSLPLRGEEETDGSAVPRVREPLRESLSSQPAQPISEAEKPVHM